MANTLQIKTTQHMQPNLRLVKAGPGAGKTYNMVNQIMCVLPNLKPHETCAIITHTNAASEVIKKRLSSRLIIPNNVFIGTIHSFLNEFLVIPFFKLNFRALFPDKSINEPDSLVFREALGFSDKPGVNFSQEKKLLQKGIVHFRTTIWTALELSKKSSIAQLIISKIRYLFVDEFQDVDPHELSILEVFLHRGVCCYFVGDVKQKLLSTYTIPQRTRCGRENPFRFLLEKYPDYVSDEHANHRSTEQIVGFLNNFGEVQQENSSNYHKNPIYFITNTDIEQAYDSFKGIVSKRELCGEVQPLDKVVLGYSFKADSRKKPIQKCYEFVTKVGLRHVTYNHRIHTTNNIIELESFLRRSSGLTTYDIQKIFDNDLILYRQLIWCLYNGMMSNSRINFFISNSDDLCSAVQYCINSLCKNYRDYLKIDDSKKGYGCKVPSFIEDVFSRQSKTRKTQAVDTDAYFSTIHSFKGLEASCVFLIVNSNALLKSFIETDRSVQNQNSNLGYVAFSRAKDLLCIMCLEKINKPLRDRLKAMQVEFV
ncbi:MAG: UvrD-helicase domain-containing protein [Candidatus Cloacimonetes bacterium]|nr:UvrD-helicase domain-containing protein [Candidatus Cloacimonadota bacterium]